MAKKIQRPKTPQNHLLHRAIWSIAQGPLQVLVALLSLLLRAGMPLANWTCHSKPPSANSSLLDTVIGFDESGGVRVLLSEVLLPCLFFPAKTHPLQKDLEGHDMQSQSGQPSYDVKVLGDHGDPSGASQPRHHLLFAIFSLDGLLAQIAHHVFHARNVEDVPQHRSAGCAQARGPVCVPLASRRQSELLHLSMDCFQRQSVCVRFVFGVSTQGDWPTRLAPPARQSSVNCACQARVFPAVNLDVKRGIGSQKDLGQETTRVQHLELSQNGHHQRHERATGKHPPQPQILGTVAMRCHKLVPRLSCDRHDLLMPRGLWSVVSACSCSELLRMLAGKIPYGVLVHLERSTEMASNSRRCHTFFLLGKMSNCLLHEPSAWNCCRLLALRICPDLAGSALVACSGHLDPQTKEHVFLIWAPRTGRLKLKGCAFALPAVLVFKAPTGGSQLCSRTPNR